MSFVFLLLVTPICPAQTQKPDEIPPLAPPLPELPPTFWERHGLAISGCAILLVGLICAVLWYLLRPVPPTPVPPYEQARSELTPLVSQLEGGKVLSQVSRVLRRYVTATFGLAAVEMTTSEFCAAVRTNERIGPELATAIGDFMRACDERKFSQSLPATPLGAARQAMELVEQTEQRLHVLRAEGAKTIQTK